jgi:ABC-2 type transport system permease protein
MGNGMALSTARATRTLAAAQVSTLLHTLRTHLREKRLLFLTIAAFLSLYAAGAYILVARGLAFVHAVPLLGPMLTERLIYVLFFFFFGMLVVSNATITGMSLFRGQETGWLLSLPLSFRSLVLWKTIEGMVLASWGLLLLSAPVLVAVGELFDSPPAFYWHTLPALLCLVTVASNLSSWLLLALIRWLRREWLRPVAVGAFGSLVVLAVAIWPSRTTPERTVDVAANVAQILQHTDAFTHPLLPSSWVAETVLAAGEGSMQQAGFYNLILFSHALLSLLVTIHVASPLFYPAWTRAMQPARRRLPAVVPRRIPWPRWLQWLPVDASDRALMMKDLRTFVREPAQWGQSVLVFGLLFLYTANLRRIVLDYHDPFWSVVTSYLNLLVCSLSLSTLTTRFIFPQISLEGQRLWLLGLSPLPLGRLLRAKLLLTTALTGTVTLSLVVISCQMLEIAWERTAFFCFCILLLTVGLNALALGLGAVFPNLRESNPAKIVSGFGGTLCLIMSFIYISACVATALIPGLPLLRPGKAPVELAQRLAALGLSLGGVLLLTLLFGLVPYWMAQKRIKNLDYFGRL